jgi:hypothetical protein
MTGECRPGSSAAPPYARPSRTALTPDPAYPPYPGQTPDVPSAGQPVGLGKRS